MNKVFSKDWTTVYEPTLESRGEGYLLSEQHVSDISEWQLSRGGADFRYLPYDVKPVPVDMTMSIRLSYAAHMMADCVEINAQKAGGAPVIVGSRFKVSQLLAELAEGHSVSYISRQFDLNREMISKILEGMSIYLDRAFSE